MYKFDPSVFSGMSSEGGLMVVFGAEGGGWSPEAERPPQIDVKELSQSAQIRIEWSQPKNIPINLSHGLT